MRIGYFFAHRKYGRKITVLDSVKNREPKKKEKTIFDLKRIEGERTPCNITLDIDMHASTIDTPIESLDNIQGELAH